MEPSNAATEDKDSPSLSRLDSALPSTSDAASVDFSINNNQEEDEDAAILHVAQQSSTNVSARVDVSQKSSSSNSSSNSSSRARAKAWEQEESRSSAQSVKCSLASLSSRKSPSRKVSIGRYGQETKKPTVDPNEWFGGGRLSVASSKSDEGFSKPNTDTEEQAGAAVDDDLNNTSTTEKFHSDAASSSDITNSSRSPHREETQISPSFSRRTTGEKQVIVDLKTSSLGGSMKNSFQDSASRSSSISSHADSVSGQHSRISNYNYNNSSTDSSFDMAQHRDLHSVVAKVQTRVEEEAAAVLEDSAMSLDTSPTSEQAQQQVQQTLSISPAKKTVMGTADYSTPQQKGKQQCQSLTTPLTVAETPSSTTKEFKVSFFEDSVETLSPETKGCSEVTFEHAADAPSSQNIKVLAEDVTVPLPKTNQETLATISLSDFLPMEVSGLIPERTEVANPLSKSDKETPVTMSLSDFLSMGLPKPKSPATGLVPEMKTVTDLLPMELSQVGYSESDLSRFGLECNLIEGLMLDPLKPKGVRAIQVSESKLSHLVEECEQGELSLLGEECELGESIIESEESWQDPVDTVPALLAAAAKPESNLSMYSEECQLTPEQSKLDESAEKQDEEANNSSTKMAAAVKSESHSSIEHTSSAHDLLAENGVVKGWQLHEEPLPAFSECDLLSTGGAVEGMVLSESNLSQLGEECELLESFVQTEESRQDPVDAAPALLAAAVKPESNLSKHGEECQLTPEQSKPYDSTEKQDERVNNLSTKIATAARSGSSLSIDDPYFVYEMLSEVGVVIKGRRVQETMPSALTACEILSKGASVEGCMQVHPLEEKKAIGVSESNLSLLGEECELSESIIESEESWQDPVDAAPEMVLSESNLSILGEECELLESTIEAEDSWQDPVAAQALLASASVSVINLSIEHSCLAFEMPSEDGVGKERQVEEESPPALSAGDTLLEGGVVKGRVHFHQPKGVSHIEVSENNLTHLGEECELGESIVEEEESRQDPVDAAPALLGASVISWGNLSKFGEECVLTPEQSKSDKSFRKQDEEERNESTEIAEPPQLQSTSNTSVFAVQPEPWEEFDGDASLIEVSPIINVSECNLSTIQEECDLGESFVEANELWQDLVDEAPALLGAAAKSMSNLSNSGEGCLPNPEPSKRSQVSEPLLRGKGVRPNKVSESNSSQFGTACQLGKSIVEAEEAWQNLVDAAPDLLVAAALSVSKFPKYYEDCLLPPEPNLLDESSVIESGSECNESSESESDESSEMQEEEEASTVSTKSAAAAISESNLSIEHSYSFCEILSADGVVEGRVQEELPPPTSACEMLSEGGIVEGQVQLQVQVQEELPSPPRVIEISKETMECSFLTTVGDSELPTNSDFLGSMIWKGQQQARQMMPGTWKLLETIGSFEFGSKNPHKHKARTSDSKDKMKIATRADSAAERKESVASPKQAKDNVKIVSLANTTNDKPEPTFIILNQSGKEPKKEHSSAPQVTSHAPLMEPFIAEASSSPVTITNEQSISPSTELHEESNCVKKHTSTQVSAVVEMEAELDPVGNSDDLVPFMKKQSAKPSGIKFALPSSLSNVETKCKKAQIPSPGPAVAEVATDMPKIVGSPILDYFTKIQSALSAKMKKTNKSSKLSSFLNKVLKREKKNVKPKPSCKSHMPDRKDKMRITTQTDSPAEPKELVASLLPANDKMKIVSLENTTADESRPFLISLSESGKEPKEEQEHSSALQSPLHAPLLEPFVADASSSPVTITNEQSISPSTDLIEELNCEKKHISTQVSAAAELNPIGSSDNLVPFTKNQSALPSETKITKILSLVPAVGEVADICLGSQDLVPFKEIESTPPTETQKTNKSSKPSFFQSEESNRKKKNIPPEVAAATTKVAAMVEPIFSDYLVPSTKLQAAPCTKTDTTKAKISYRLSPPRTPYDPFAPDPTQEAIILADFHLKSKKARHSPPLKRCTNSSFFDPNKSAEWEDFSTSSQAFNFWRAKNAQKETKESLSLLGDQLPKKKNHKSFSKQQRGGMLVTLPDLAAPDH